VSTLSYILRIFTECEIRRGEGGILKRVGCNVFELDHALIVYSYNRACIQDCEGTISSQNDSEIWLVSGRPTAFTEMPDPRSLPQVWLQSLLTLKVML
jgi:hypothetical protein